VLGTVRVMAPPFMLRETPPHARRPAPLLGEHTHEVLSQVLGLEEAEIAALEYDGVLD
jgi:crotonobetainyl-CoA:carnitine CoA-transferase CaiB-like acyl-CoA transferase